MKPFVQKGASRQMHVITSKVPGVWVQGMLPLANASNAPRLNLFPRGSWHTTSFRGIEFPPKSPARCQISGITESQNRIGWKRPLRSSSPTVNLTLPRPPLHHVPEHLIQTSFKYLQGWGLHHFPGQPLPMLDNPFREVKFPNIQSKPPLAQLEAISSRPITCDLGEETDPTSLHPPFRQL
ncbi:hypothetical protein QYF61_012119 [Mycteria americana]|uniref:Uncharacterized protein n=1 Tax=Mycteria americana TaxID=33587 RepID=A0AAN7NE18_MYCAM|nr:hypothetical protein QYF61_012119 [Mycteria americana]